MYPLASDGRIRMQVPPHPLRVPGGPHVLTDYPPALDLGHVPRTPSCRQRDTVAPVVRSGSCPCVKPHAVSQTAVAGHYRGHIVRRKGSTKSAWCRGRRGAPGMRQFGRPVPQAQNWLDEIPTINTFPWPLWPSTASTGLLAGRPGQLREPGTGFFRRLEWAPRLTDDETLSSDKRPTPRGDGDGKMPRFSANQAPRPGATLSGQCG